MVRFGAVRVLPVLLGGHLSLLLETHGSGMVRLGTTARTRLDPALRA